MSLQIIDTPGVCDPARDKQELADEIVKCLMLCSPGPHALLFVTKGNDRFTDEEIEAYYRLKNVFSSKVTNHIIVVFTGGDVLAKWGKTMEDVLKEAKDAINFNKSKRRAKSPADITKVLEETSNRYTLFNNEGDAATKDQQVLALLDMVMEMINKNGDEPYFQNKTTRTVSDARETALQRIMTEKGISRREAEEVLSASLLPTTAVTSGPRNSLSAVELTVALYKAPFLEAADAVGAVVSATASVCSTLKEKCSVM